MTDGAGVEAYEYDDLGRLVEVGRGTDAFSYAWDDAGHLTGRTYPDGTEVDLYWDEDGRLVEVAVGADATAYAYDPAGNLTEAAFGNGTTEERAYDQAGRVTEVRHEEGAASQSLYQYQYDGAGNPTRMDSPEGVTTYHYDDLDRLVEACFDEDCPLPSSPAILWTYDEVGNRTAESRPEGTITYTYDAADRLLTLTDPQQLVTEFAHDANGNNEYGYFFAIDRTGHRIHLLRWRFW